MEQATIMKRRAFTLIELLIVVAIIGILAAIAVPNFLNAQIRAKTARSVADMRAIKLGLHQYRLDNNAYPNYVGGVPGRLARLIRLTTPVAYLSTIPTDPFRPKELSTDAGDVYPYWPIDVADGKRERGEFSHMPRVEQAKGTFILLGAAPNGLYEPSTAEGALGIHMEYDASNGVVSIGDIYVLGP